MKEKDPKQVNLDLAYSILKQMNRENLEKVVEMRKNYEKEVKEYEKLQSEFISEEVKKLVSIAQELFPKYGVFPIDFGIRIISQKEISEDGNEAKNENSGLGSWTQNPSIYQQLKDKIGPNVIKTTREDIAWFDAPEDSEFYTDKTSWVYTFIEFEFKKPYLNEKFGFKTAPKSKV